MDGSSYRGQLLRLREGCLDSGFKAHRAECLDSGIYVNGAVWQSFCNKLQHSTPNTGPKTLNRAKGHAKHRVRIALLCRSSQASGEVRIACVVPRCGMG